MSGVHQRVNLTGRNMAALVAAKLGGRQVTQIVGLTRQRHRFGVEPHRNKGDQDEATNQQLQRKDS